jgi:hypothetical protein
MRNKQAEISRRNGTDIAKDLIWLSTLHFIMLLATAMIG